MLGHAMVHKTVLKHLLWLHPVYIHTSDFDALIKVNTSLLERATKAIEILSLDNLQHVVLQTGGKGYGLEFTD